jgi:D-serine dehydratase
VLLTAVALGLVPRGGAVIIPPEIERRLREREPFLWINCERMPAKVALQEVPISVGELYDAERRWNRMRGLLAALFPELAASGGHIESPLLPVPRLQNAVSGAARCGRWLVKADHALPVAGSIKARGGVYEVLVHAEKLALQERLISEADDRIALQSTAVRALFARHHISVGSTGNLGLSVGIMGAALGFKVTVHMSAAARSWKIERLRVRGVEVIEHMGDYGTAVAAGRSQAADDPSTYFVDDENSRNLFLGYAIAALRLSSQITELGVSVDERHPLFVYLPCGVGGAPGGITFGLKSIFGDHVHCFFGEPTASPSMLVRLASSVDRPVSIGVFGLNSETEADGLAVARASELAARVMRPLLSGIFTVADRDLFEDLYLLERLEGLRVEPSAVAGFRGPGWVQNSTAGRQYLLDTAQAEHINRATHILWTTGGAFVPEAEYGAFHERGRASLPVHGA